MIEEEIAKWTTFNSEVFKSQCCRCQSSLTTINSCISSSQLKIFKNEVKKSKEKISKVRTKNNQIVLCQKMASMEIKETKSSNWKSKFRSVSVDNLESVVKQLIQEALKDDEETIQLQMVVCREDFLPQYMNEKSENSVSKQTSEISNNNKEKSEKTNLENRVSKINHHDEIQTNKEPEKNMENILSSTKLNEDSIILKESETKKNEETKNIENSHKSERIVEFKGLKPQVKKNLRSRLTKNEETNDKKEEIVPQETIQSKGDFTFEAWKQAKTRAYKQLLKEEKRKRQRELLENAKKLERERAAHIVYLNWKRDQQKQQKLKRMSIKAANETAMVLKMKSDEKRYANLQAFKEWKKRKDTKIKREKMTWRADYQQSYLQNRPTPSGKPETCKPKSNLDFDALLDQLDNVLHKKYLKERRFQVRSFYCQPTYFGTAAIIQ